MAHHSASCRHGEASALAGFFEHLPFPLGYASPLATPMTDDDTLNEAERRTRQDRRIADKPLAMGEPDRRQRPERRQPVVEYLPIEEYIEVLEVGQTTM